MIIINTQTQCDLYDSKNLIVMISAIRFFSYFQMTKINEQSVL